MTTFRGSLRAWYRMHKRDLPWRRTHDAYAILVSEVMLQQTQVERVIPKYDAFMRAFPNARSLARAPLRDVIRAWSGLGYNARARRLWLAAQEVDRAGMPRREADLIRLPGVGPYTAAAVASFAFGRRTAVVDTNVRRVLGRAFLGRDGIDGPAARDLAKSVLPARASADWHQALMDLGARHCRARPRCATCPARRACAYARSPAPPARLRAPARGTPFTSSTRYYRGRIVEALRGAPSLSLLRLGAKVKPGFAESDVAWLQAMLDRLARDGLVALDRERKRASLP